MENIVALSGWAQPVDALKEVAPTALFLDYTPAKNIEDFFATLRRPLACKLLLGWSLGGYVAVQAVAAGVIKPQALLLLAAPFQCVASVQFPDGVPRKLMDEMIAGFRINAPTTQKTFNALIATGDSKKKEIARQLLKQPQPDSASALRWLEVLAESSCADVDFSDFPPTTLVHGKNDKVINPVQSSYFAQRIPNARLEVWEGCGHAPHLHNVQKLQQLLQALS